MKKIVCGALGTIYYASINEKNHIMSAKDRVDVTDDAINAVLNHLMTMDGWDGGFSGYNFDKKDGTGTICLCVYDRNKWDLLPKEEKKDVTPNE